MKDLLLHLVKSLVDHPKEVQVEQQEQDGATILSLQVHQEDIGKVIGKGGRIIKSLRNVVKILAVKEQKRVDIELKEVSS